MQSTHVTNRQGSLFASLCRLYGVPRHELKTFLEDEERYTTFLKQFTIYPDWYIGLQKEAKKLGVNVYLIQDLEVDYTKTHESAAMGGAPKSVFDTNTPDDVLRVGDKYELPSNKVEKETIVLIAWPKGNHKKLMEFGAKNGLSLTTPHVPFALGEKFPDLNLDLMPGDQCVLVQETTGCIFKNVLHFCYIFWNEDRRCGLIPSDDLRIHKGGDWYAFKKVIL